MTAVHEGRSVEVRMRGARLDVLAAGRVIAQHERFWRPARRRLGDAQGTRALIEVRRWHRRLPFSSVHEALDALTQAGSADSVLVTIKARRIADRRSKTQSLAQRRLERFERPALSLAGYDDLLAGDTR